MEVLLHSLFEVLPIHSTLKKAWMSHLITVDYHSRTYPLSQGNKIFII